MKTAENQKVDKETKKEYSKPIIKARGGIINSATNGCHDSWKNEILVVKHGNNTALVCFGWGRHDYIVCLRQPRVHITLTVF